MQYKDIFNKVPGIAKFETSAFTPEQIIPSDKPEVIFSGKSNVGKSSMINRLVSRKGLARTSSSPGKTASINFYDCGFFRLVDLPGYGYAKVSKQDKEKWAELVSEYFEQSRRMAIVIQLIDSRREPTDDDMTMLNFIIGNNMRFAVALTKTDKLKPSQLAARRKEVPEELAFCKSKVIFTSSGSGLGMDELKKEIIDACRTEN